MVIAQDKLMHYFVGTLIVAVSYPLVGLWAIVVTAVAAVGKELYDKYSGKGTPELMDVVYTMFGGLVVVAAYCYCNVSCG